MDTSRLAAFIAAADAGSLSLGARRLGAQLSTVSRQISDLEQTVGAALLVRTGRGVRLTPAGERFLERARHIVREVEAATAEARGQRVAALTLLRLSAPLELSLRLLPAPLAELARRHPDLSVDVHSDARKVSLLEEDYDAAIRLGPVTSPDLVARRLGQVSLVVCGREDAARAIRSPSDLASRGFVLVAGARSDLAGVVRGRELRLDLRGRCRVSTFTEAAELAALGAGFAVLPSFTAAPFLASERLVRVAPGLSLPRVEVSLLHTQRHRGSPVLQDLWELSSAALEAAERAVSRPMHSM